MDNGPRTAQPHVYALALFVMALLGAPAWAEFTDLTQTPNAVNEGIAKISRTKWARDAATRRRPGRRCTSSRAIRSARSVVDGSCSNGNSRAAQGLGPREDGVGADIHATPALGAGMADSCAGCHGRPRGAAGSGGDVFTRPDSRDAPHLFGLGLKEMLGDEMTTDLRGAREGRIAGGRNERAVTVALATKGMLRPLDRDPERQRRQQRHRGCRCRPSGQAVLRARRHVQHPSIRRRRAQRRNGSAGARYRLLTAAGGGRVVTPSGMVLDGTLDHSGARAATDAGADPDGDGVATRSTSRWSTISSSIC